MGLVTITENGIRHNSVVRNAFFDEARERLLNAGFEPTVWLDYLIGHKDGFRFEITIRKNCIAYVAINKRDKAYAMGSTRVIDNVVKMLD